MAEKSEKIVSRDRQNEWGEVAACEKNTANAVAKICRMAKKNDDFLSGFHALITDSDFIKLCKYFERNNIFGIVGRTQQENWHSSFLAWLLNPEGAHGLGHFPLRCLLAKACTLARKQNGLEGTASLPAHGLIEVGDFSGTVVRPESIGQSEQPEKQVQYQENVDGRRYNQDIRFDIALSTWITPIATSNGRKPKKRRLVLICENKIKSHEKQFKISNDMRRGETISQTEMYADFWYGDKAFFPISADPSDHPLRTKGATAYCILLFLSAKGHTADDRRFVNMRYNSLYESVLLPALNHPDISDDGKRYLQEYIDLLDLKGYIESEEKKELFKRIYKKHGEVFCQYLAYKIFQIVCERVCKKHPTSSSRMTPEARADIIHWLYYFSDINEFKITQAGCPKIAYPTSDFSKQYVTWNIPTRLKKNHRLACYAQNTEILDGNHFVKVTTGLVRTICEWNEKNFAYIADVEGKYMRTLAYLIKSFPKNQDCLDSTSFFIHKGLPQIVQFITKTMKVNNCIL